MVLHCPSEDVEAAPVAMDVTPTQRILSACAGVLTTSLVVTPMDVVKTRLQAAQAESVNQQRLSSFPSSGYNEPCEICRQQGRTFTTSARARSGAALSGVIDAGAGSAHGQLRPPALPSSTWEALHHIARLEGPRGLYRGVEVSLVMAVPSTVLYYSLYDDFLLRMDRAGAGSILAPVTAGAIARVLATICMAPLELVRTRIQAQRAATAREEVRAARGGLSNFPMVSVARGVSTVVREEGVLALWRGVGTTMWRDVPFSMVYWLGYENLKSGFGCDRRGTEDKQRSSADFLLRSFAAGAVSGVVSSLLTHPFDVVKTQRQVALTEERCCENRPPPTPRSRQSPGTFEVMRSIVESRGVGGLYTGALPRVAKVAPACAIMIFSYEAGKRFFAERNARLAAEYAAQRQ